MKNIENILSEIFHFLVVKFSVYLNRRVFAMNTKPCFLWKNDKIEHCLLQFC